MSSPLATIAKFGQAGYFGGDSVGTLALQPSGQAGIDSVLPGEAGTELRNFKYVGSHRDGKLTDYLVLGLLSVLIHGTVVDHFDRIALEEEIIAPVKPESKVQITLSRPKPVPPPPVVKPAPPPVQKVVPLKPQKPKPVPKVVEQVPVVDQTPVISDAPPTQVAASPAPPAPVVEEKITQPSAGADYLNNPAPEYPEIAQERGWEGKVLMKVHVQPDGKPDSVTVVKSSGQKVLDDAAVKTVYKWSFVPAKRGETAIAGNVTVPITFNLS